jgi:hypothetical protein
VQDQEAESPKRSPQIFISYNSEDRDNALRIARTLKDAGLRPWVHEWEIGLGDNIAESMETALRTSDVVLVLVSRKSAASSSTNWTANFEQELADRAITVVPAMVEPGGVPGELLNRRVIDLTRDGATQKLADQLTAAVNIDFATLTPQSFENLVGDLLSDLGFASVQRPPAFADFGADFVAVNNVRDPFGTTTSETWFVQVKVHREKRVSVAVLQRMFGHLAMSRGTTKGLIVTNGQLTSSARTFLSEMNDKLGRQLRVIDGTELKTLLLQRPIIVRRYFPEAKT